MTAQQSTIFMCGEMSAIKFSEICSLKEKMTMTERTYFHPCTAFAGCFIREGGEARRGRQQYTAANLRPLQATHSEHLA